MATKICLWAMMLLYSFYLAGHLYDLTANVPNWKSGDVTAVRQYRDFYHHSTPARFFAPLVFALPLVSLLSLLLLWSHGGALRVLLGLSFVIAAGVTIWTFLFFIPINQYIWAGEYDPVQLKEFVTKWVQWEYLRVTLIGIGLASTIWALQIYQE